ncbi:hypothetical protein [Pseudoduganella aquatica]|nr:hypothetical protein [Pseudoduganella aquatica]
MTIGLTLKTLAIVALVAASTVIIVLNEHAGMAISLSQHAAF